MADRIKVYLAGPITNCNDDQKRKWRLDLKRKLRDEGYHAVDPTDTNARTGALSVSVDIEEVDVVIANMWRESVGTVVGIVQAKRLGIPVILIDQHYINSSVLDSLVDDKVRSEDAAVGKMKDIVKILRPSISVTKRSKNGKLRSDTLDIRKLQRSLRSSCAAAAIDDPVVCTMLLRGVRRAIVAAAPEGSIRSEDIRRLIFEEVAKLASGDIFKSAADNQKLKDSAEKLQQKWEDYEDHIKNEIAQVQELTEIYENEVEEQSAEISRLQLLLYKAGRSLALVEGGTNVTAELAAQLQEILGGKRALCVYRAGKPNFRNAFSRLGLRPEDFERFFQETELDGKQSNLNLHLKTWLDSHSYVLYAGHNLRHISDHKVRDADNFVRGFGPNDAIRRLLQNHAQAPMGV